MCDERIEGMRNMYTPEGGGYYERSKTMSIELPLFPLNVVLFPGADLPLHIFEPRYRQMINECYSQGKPFGVVLMHPDSEHLHEKPYPVGTLAEIEALVRLDDGRMNLIARGGKRFHIQSLHREKPYLSGLVETFEDLPEYPETLEACAKQVKELFQSYLEMLLEVAGKKGTQLDLPTDPEELSHFVAYFLDIEDEEKQGLLELNITSLRLEEEIHILRKEVPFIRQMLDMSKKYKVEGADKSRLN